MFGIDSGERLLRAHFRSICWHAYDNDLLVTELDHATAYCCSYPPGESSTATQREGIANALASQISDGVLRIRTRTGAFVARNQR